ncbi:hypothetical protein [Rheinheimera salexigens]|uniref:Uncharacterized protein n=1 Tax=Rheinheimera salexigens TaxID=1628148 RepID=A0A1E7Q253_9GAMM|nr:hypothetical protein [Rheinheimera salexigens]OEY68206.1 hypothetical protein BI198_00455 [Rheinheimera salexigens]
MITTGINLLKVLSRVTKPLIIGAVLVGCKPVTEIISTPQAQSQVSAEQLVELERGIRDLISSPIAQDIASCKIVTLNTNDCQQTATHLLYSIENTNEPVLLALVEKYNKALESKTAESTTESGTLSCVVSQKPSVILQKDLCIPVQFATE